MNILHLVDEPYDSGIVHYALTAARGLKDRGHSVRVGGLAGEPPLDQAARLHLDTEPVRKFPAGLLDVRRLARGGRLDIINAHTGSAHTLAVTAIRALRRAPKVVRTRGDARAFRRTATGPALWRRTAGFIAATESILQDFHHTYPRLSVTSRAVLPGIPLPPGGWSPEPPQEGPPRVGIVGRLDPVKGHVDFLRAAARVARAVPDAAFVVVGREENVTIRHLSELAAGLGIAKSVEFLGHVSNPLEIMRLCRLGVIASTGSEAISRVAMEWMSVGRPVVATLVGCLPELVADKETGFLVPPRDPESMSRAILHLLANPGESVEMGRQARQRFEKHFSLSRFISETEAFYENVLHGLPSR